MQSVIDSKYELVSIIGSGGFGTVYSARHLELNRVVALKMLQQRLPTEEEKWRFEREALALSKLNHKNIVRFYGFGLWNEKPYIVMEQIVGRSLFSEIQAEGSLKPDKTLDIVTQIATALSHAHANGIVHRDLKPENVLLVDTEGGVTVKVIDFGLVRLLPEFTEEQRKLTLPGAGVGTVLYMSPEQCTGKEADQRSDIYSLGCIMHTCLTGSPPFAANQTALVMRAHATKPLARLQETRPDLLLPDGLQVIIDNCTYKDPQKRYQSANELLEALQVQCSSGERRVPATTAIRIAATLKKNKHGIKAFSIACLSLMGICIFSVLLRSEELRLPRGINQRENDSLSMLKAAQALDRNALYKFSEESLTAYEQALSLGARDHQLSADSQANALLRLSQMYAVQGRSKKAANTANQLILFYARAGLPRDWRYIRAAVTRLESLAAGRSFAQAEAEAERFLNDWQPCRGPDEQIAGSKAALWIAAARAHFDTGAFGSAAKILNETEKTRDLFAEQERLRLQGDLDLVGDRPAAAEDAYRQALLVKDPPFNAGLNLSLVRAEIATGSWSQAKRDLQERVPKDVRAEGVQALLLLRCNDFAGAEASINAVLKQLKDHPQDRYRCFGFYDVPIFVRNAAAVGQTALAKNVQDQFSTLK